MEIYYFMLSAWDDIKRNNRFVNIIWMQTTDGKQIEKFEEMFAYG